MPPNRRGMRVGQLSVRLHLPKLEDTLLLTTTPSTATSETSVDGGNS